MTTRPTDEEIRAMADSLMEPDVWLSRTPGTEGENGLPFTASEMLAAWLAERKAAMDGVTDEMVSDFIRKYEASDNFPTFSGLRKTAVRAALQSIARPVASVSDALNFLEEWALAGNQLHGDDIQRFHATVERIAPVAKLVSVPDDGKLWAWIASIMRQGVAIDADHKDKGYEAYCYRIDTASSERLDELKAMLSTSPQPQQAAPDGWKLVPLELTQEMLNSVDDIEVGGSCFSCTKCTASYADAMNMWKAMLSAAPAYNGKKEG